MEPVRVSIRELKNRLSHYLRFTKANRTVEITDRGRPIGRIIPLGMTAEERMEEAAKSGLITWMGKKLGPSKPMVKTKGAIRISDIVVEDRR